jgi:hypothetical protein
MTDDLKALVESLIFVSQEPLSLDRLQAVLEGVPAVDIERRPPAIPWSIGPPRSSCSISAWTASKGCPRKRRSPGSSRRRRPSRADHAKYRRRLNLELTIRGFFDRMNRSFRAFRGKTFPDFQRRSFSP